MPFQKGNKLGSGRKTGSKNKQTVWVLEELKKEGVNYTKILAKAILDKDWEAVNTLSKLAPHIANKPKEHLGLEGIEGLVVKELKDDKPKE